MSYGVSILSISEDFHYNDVILSTMASQITSLTIVYSTVCTGADERKHQSSTSLAFVRGIHRWPVNSPLKGPVTRKMFPIDDVIMTRIVCQITASLIVSRLIINLAFITLSTFYRNYSKKKKPFVERYIFQKIMCSGSGNSKWAWSANRYVQGPLRNSPIQHDVG